MKLLKNTLIAALAITGICAVLYLCWQAYQQRNQEERARAFILRVRRTGIQDRARPHRRPNDQSLQSRSA